MKARRLREIPVPELVARSVWEYDSSEGCGESEKDETWLRPVQGLPVKTLRGRVVITTVTLVNGNAITASLSNITLDNPRATEEFIFLSIETNDKWFHLARYFDPWYSLMGPDQLAAFLGLKREEVFPITYDISAVAIGHPDVVRCSVPAEPRERLSRDDRLRLTLATL